MPWIRTITNDEATGRLEKSFRAAIQRAGRVFGIVRAQSLAPAVLDASMGLYQRIMYASEGLSRRRREMLATIVSRVNDCHY
jgi:alkylhydroperoxidase family enzyme